jgi:thiol-disulfide isomerase/thioredoxin
MSRLGVFAALTVASCAHSTATEAPPALTLLRLSDLPAVKRAVHPHGRPMLIHFWALWCGSCVEELPRQLAFAKQLSEAGVDVLFVDADGFEKESQVRTRLGELGGLQVGRQAMLNMALDVTDITPLLAAEWGGVLPATFALGADGKLGATVVGPASAQDEGRLLAALSVQAGPKPARSAVGPGP